MSALAALAACGCGARGDVDLLEARLRQQEDSLARLESQLAAARSELSVVEKERNDLRQQLAGRSETILLPEQAHAFYRAAGIEFNKLLTGGFHQDGRPGDEVLNAVLMPRDADGELLKLPGAIALEVLDLAKPPDEQRIARWEFSEEETREHWHRALIGSGYVFRLPWPNRPESPELLLHGRLTTPDGRQFDTSQVIRVAPPLTATR
jgi:hypothetical protein